MKQSSSFESSPEFAAFEGLMKKVIVVPKAELDKRVAASKEASPRKNNPSAAGRKLAPSASGKGS